MHVIGSVLPLCQTDDTTLSDTGMEAGWRVSDIISSFEYCGKALKASQQLWYPKQVWPQS